MGEVVITYETLYELLRREKSRPELQKLDDDFFDNIVAYLKEKQDFVNLQKDKNTLFSSEVDRIKREIDNIRKIIKELYERRELKIINGALTKSIIGVDNPTNMLNEEKELYDHLHNDLNDFRESILHKILNGSVPVKPKAIKSENSAPLEEAKLVKGKNLTIRFLSAVPKFAGVDGYTYGPFEKEDIAEMPAEVAELLIQNTRAENC